MVVEGGRGVGLSLEIQLRKFSCLTKGDIIAFHYVGRMYELLVVDLKPANAVSIVECDMNVEFDAPEGYVEPKREKKISESIPGGEQLPILPGSSFLSPSFYFVLLGDVGDVGDVDAGVRDGAADGGLLRLLQGLHGRGPAPGRPPDEQGPGQPPGEDRRRRPRPLRVTQPLSSPCPVPDRICLNLSLFLRGAPMTDYLPGTVNFYRKYVRPDAQKKEDDVCGQPQRQHKRAREMRSV